VSGSQNADSDSSLLASAYAALLIPSAPGALRDLAKNQHLGWIINSFMAEESTLYDSVNFPDVDSQITSAQCI
jgi:hypothetical protein